MHPITHQYILSIDFYLPAVEGYQRLRNLQLTICGSEIGLGMNKRQATTVPFS